jgi:hypothetical protein
LVVHLKIYLLDQMKYHKASSQQGYIVGHKIGV